MCPASHSTSCVPVKSSRMTAIQTIISNNFLLTHTCQQNLQCRGSVHTARQGSYPGLLCPPLLWMVAAGISPLFVILLSARVHVQLSVTSDSPLSYQNTGDNSLIYLFCMGTFLPLHIMRKLTFAIPSANRG